MDDDWACCIGCLQRLTWCDRDPNGDENASCVQCRAEESHDFDVEPWARFDRYGDRIDSELECGNFNPTHFTKGNKVPAPNAEYATAVTRDALLSEVHRLKELLPKDNELIRRNVLAIEARVPLTEMGEPLLKSYVNLLQRSIPNAVTV